jgi:sulfite exporter TauE/SafE
VSALWIPILTASLAGSVHCAAMCGPFAAASGGSASSARGRIAAQAAYHTGRLVTYLSLGAAAGLAGGAVDLAGNAAGVQRISAFVAGALLLVWGVSTLAATRGLVKLKTRAPAVTLLSRVLAKVSALPAMPRALLLGLSTAFVPCGWLYAFVATAAGSGSVSSAVIVLGAFWLGTVPALVVASLGFRGLTARLGARAKTVTATVLVASGLLVLGLRLDAPPPTAATSDTPAMPESCPLHRH